MESTETRELRAQLEQHHEACYGWALHCCAYRSAEAEEVLHNAYLKVLEGRARYDRRSSFKTWLFSVIRHTAADERRRQWLRRLALIRYEQSAPPARVQSSAADQLQRSRLQRAFEQALAKLPSRQHQVMHLVFYQDLTIQEAASVMAVSLGSARQHYERGKRRLREILAQSEEFDENR
jgi:RNA polymerase sigma-70 factor (ECF subfamily)